ncbi:MAG: S8 family peptidase, partial [Pseudomonadota bacterium]
MKLSFLVFFGVLSVLAFPADYVVLFKQAEIGVGSLEHGAYTQVLQESNQKSVSDLEKWISRHRIKPEKKIKNLWLVRGATVSMSQESATKLKKEPWVHGVYLDQTRHMLPPNTNYPAGGSLGELGAEATWGLEKMGISQLRAEFPNVDGSGISIGVLDTGIQSKHPELSGKVTHFRDFVNGISNEYDDHGHGTHVAGTIVGQNTGLAPKANILMAKIFGAVGGGKDSVILE